ncbi:hypothetical protein KI387_012028, partial [Taxus chinensis]
TTGCPLLILPIWVSSRYNKNQGCPFQNVHVTLRLFTSSFGIGILLSIYNALYSWCLRYLPLSTSAMVFASQLGFNTIFAYLIVRQKSTPYSINALIFLTFGRGILSFNDSSDRPEEVIRVHYVVGFILTTSAICIYGLILPLIELIYRETSPQITYTLVMEMQLIMSVCASVVCTIDMVVYKDILAIVREANASPLGEGLYYTSLLACVVCWQLFFIGVFGIIFPQLVDKINPASTRVKEGVVIWASNTHLALTMDVGIWSTDRYSCVRSNNTHLNQGYRLVDMPSQISATMHMT